VVVTQAELLRLQLAVDELTAANEAAHTQAAALETSVAEATAAVEAGLAREALLSEAADEAKSAAEVAKNRLAAATSKHAEAAAAASAKTAALELSVAQAATELEHLIAAKDAIATDLAAAERATADAKDETTSTATMVQSQLQSMKFELSTLAICPRFPLLHCVHLRCFCSTCQSDKGWAA
jgi:chromosome segregation ATPase